MIGLVLLCKQVVESLSLYEISSTDIGYVRYAVRTHAVSPIKTTSTQTAKVDNKPATSTVTKSAFRARGPTSTVIS